MTPLTKDLILKELHDFRKSKKENDEKVNLESLSEFIFSKFYILQKRYDEHPLFYAVTNEDIASQICDDGEYCEDDIDFDDIGSTVISYLEDRCSNNLSDDIADAWSNR